MSSVSPFRDEVLAEAQPQAYAYGELDDVFAEAYEAEAYQEDPELWEEPPELEDEAARGGAIPSSRLEWPGASAAQLAFMRAVYDRHVERSRASGRRFVADLPRDALGTIYGRHEARKDAAEAARRLLAAANGALVADGYGGRIQIGIVSAYRSAELQFLIWQGKNRSGGFPYYYRQTASARRRLGDEHGPAAVELLANELGTWIAAPGYSNHNDGLAIDFGTALAGAGSLGKLGPRAWFHKWLRANASRFGFRPYEKEAWHWEYRPSGAVARELDELVFGEAATGVVPAGRLEVAKAPVLASHRGKAPDLVLRWNEMPAARAEVDVVVHLHGYSRPWLNLPRDIEKWSGLDLAPVDGAAGAGRTRPTLTVLPRGHYTGEQRGKLYRYTFPALLKKDALTQLVAFALERFAGATGGPTPRPARLILTAHSGGGAPLMRLLTLHEPDEVHAFDALYQDAGALAEWARRRIRRDSAGGSAPGAMRVFYGGGTRGYSRALAAALEKDLAGVADRYRVEASTLGHWQIARQYGWRVLADPAADVPNAKREPVRRRELEHEELAETDDSVWHRHEEEWDAGELLLEHEPASEASAPDAEWAEHEPESAEFASEQPWTEHEPAWQESSPEPPWSGHEAAWEEERAPELLAEHDQAWQEAPEPPWAEHEPEWEEHAHWAGDGHDHHEDEHELASALEDEDADETIESGEVEVTEAEAFDETDGAAAFEELELEAARPAVIVFPSGATLPVVAWSVRDGDEHFDPNASGNPLLDTSGTLRSTKLSANFTAGELARSGGRSFDRARIDPKLVACLEALRERVGRAVVVTSGYRPYLYNVDLYAKRGQTPTKSQHSSGRAADVKVKGLTGMEIAKAAIDACGTEIGVGIGADFAHVDVRGRWDRWTYPRGAGTQPNKQWLAEIDAYRRGRLDAPAAPTAGLPTRDVTPPAAVAPQMLEALGRGLWDTAVRLAIGSGITDENRLTNMLFYLRHPELQGRKIEPHQRDLAREWIEIRDRWVRPGLSRIAPGAATTPPPRVPPTPSPVRPAPAGLLAWPRILPIAKRDRATAITVTKGNDFVDVPRIATPALDAEQRAIVEQINAFRETLPDYPLKKTTYKGNKGYVLGDSGAREKLTPKELQSAGNDPETRAKKIVWKELGHEGTLDSINTYDNQILTWGKGFSARSGSMNEVLEIMFRNDPAAKELLLRAGIDCDRDPKSWKVVNRQTGMIETGENALRLLQFDPKLLGVFVTLGRDPRHRQHALEAQWQAMTKPRKAAAVPKYALGWSEPAIALAAHLSHWTPAFGWGRNDYSRTGGDLVDIAATWARAAKRIPAWAATLPNGAIVAPSDIMQPGHRLLGFAGGAGGRAVAERARIVTGDRAALGADARYAGHVLLPVYGTSNQYYDLGTAGS